MSRLRGLRALPAAALCLIASCHRVPAERAARGPRFELGAADALVDGPWRVRLVGAPPRARVTITAAVPFGERVLRASAVYAANDRGDVDLETTPPLAGDYAGADATGLLWAMHADTSGRSLVAAGAERWAPPAPFDVTLIASIDSTEVARAVARRRFAAAGVERRDVNDAGVVAHLWLPSPNVSRPLPVVVTLTGSEGGFDDLHAALLASHGFAALAVAAFRAPGLPDELFEVPVETVERAVAWIGRQPGLDARRIAVRGASRGGELALLAASLIPSIRAVVAQVPADVVGQGIDRAGRSRATSAWTWRGAPLPFLPQTPPESFTAQFAHPPPYRLRPLHEASRRDADALRTAAIAVERIAGPVLLISASDDQYWPSEEHADAVIARLRASAFAHHAEHLRNPGAGHQILPPYLPAGPRTEGQFWLAGGTREAYARADVRTWRRTLSFLRDALAP